MMDKSNILEISKSYAPSTSKLYGPSCSNSSVPATSNSLVPMGLSESCTPGNFKSSAKSTIDRHVERQMQQFYIHTDIVNWIRTCLEEENHGDLVTIYDRVNHIDFEACSTINIHGEIKRVELAYKKISSMVDIAQYKMPWISEATYYVRTEQQRDVIMQQLGVKIDKYLNEMVCTTINWFGSNNLCIFSFSSDLAHDELINIDVEFKNFGAIYEKPLFIAPCIALHESLYPPIAMATNVLTIFSGKFLDYLEIDDIFALEIAIKDYRLPNYDCTLAFDIEHHLRKRLPFLYSDQYANTFTLPEMKTSTSVSHFICKYYRRFTSMTVSCAFREVEIRLLSDLYNVKIDYKHHTCSHSIDEHGNELLSVSIFIENYNRPSELKRHDIHWRDDSEWTCIMANYNRNDQITITVSKGMKCKPELLTSLFATLYHRFQNHNRNKGVLFLRDIDLSRGCLNLFWALSTIFGHIEYHNIDFELPRFLAMLNYPVGQTTLIFKNCHITSNLLSISVAGLVHHHLKTMLNNEGYLLTMKFVDMDFKLETFFMVCRTLSCDAEVTFERCRLLPDNNRLILTEKLQLSVIQFFKMEFNVALIWTLLDKFGGDTEVQFNECNIAYSNFYEKNSIKLSHVEFFSTNFASKTTIFLILKSFSRNVKVEIENCIILPGDERNHAVTWDHRISIAMTSFQLMNFKTDTILDILQNFSNRSTVHFKQCTLCPTNADKLSNTSLKLLAVIFDDITLDIATILPIWAKFSRNAQVFITRCRILCSASPLSITLSKPLKFQFRFIEFLIAEELCNIIQNFHEDSIVEFNSCQIVSLNKLVDKKMSEIHLAMVKFIEMQFNIKELSIFLGKFGTCTVATFDGCTLYPSIDMPMILHEIAVASFKNMTIEMSTFCEILGSFSTVSLVYITDCEIPTQMIVNDIGFRLAYVEFANMFFRTKSIIEILKKFPQKSQVDFHNCHFLGNNLVVSEQHNSIKLSIVQFIRSSFKTQALLQIIEKISSSDSRVIFDACDIDGLDDFERDIPIPRIAIQLKRIEFHDMHISIGLLSSLQRMDGEYSVAFYNCPLNNQDVVNICCNTKVFGTRFGIYGKHHVTKIIFAEIIFEYFRIHMQSYAMFAEQIDFKIPMHVMPDIVSAFKNDFDWENLKLRVVRENDVSIKIDLLRDGNVIDLFYELNGLPPYSDEDVVDYC